MRELLGHPRLPPRSRRAPACPPKAAGLRLRSILMTMLATPFGLIPLQVASSGPGAASRFAISFTLGVGMLVGAVFTILTRTARLRCVRRRTFGDDDFQPGGEIRREPSESRPTASCIVACAAPAGRCLPGRCIGGPLSGRLASARASSRPAPVVSTGPGEAG
ncbi:MAG: efflux RND transporter permease subunit [Lautropia sp.]